MRRWLLSCTECAPVSSNPGIDHSVLRERGRSRNMRYIYSRRTIVSAGAAAALAIPFGVGRFSAIAQESTPIAEGSPALPPGCTVVASGLFNPRYVAVDTD